MTPACFALTGAGLHPVVAEISGDDASIAVPGADRLVFRAAPEAAAASTPVAVTPLSTEIVRLMEADDAPYEVARAASGGAAGDFSRRSGRRSGERDRAGFAPRGSGGVGRAQPPVRPGGENGRPSRHLARRAREEPERGRSGMTMKDAQQAAMALEGIPRYDHLFIIMLENKATSAIRQSPLAPHINAYLDAGNEFTSYYATGNPSEPNRIAVSSGDDFGVTDDNAWNCVPEGDTRGPA